MTDEERYENVLKFAAGEFMSFMGTEIFLWKYRDKYGNI